MKKLDFNSIQKEYGELFWVKSEKSKFNKERKYKDIDFDDFILLLDDYYMMYYAPILSRNAWLVFAWIRYSTRNDGFVSLSYNRMLEVFLDGADKKMSKPTFFNCIDELINNDLVVKINTYKAYDKSYSKDANVYAIVSKVDIVYDACDLIQDEGINNDVALAIVTGKIERQEKTEKKKVNYKKKYKLLMIRYSKVLETVEDFFDFLGSYNNSGGISISRKVKILYDLKPYLDGDFTVDDIANAMKLTMRNTAKSNNKKKEKYMFTILENMTEKDEEEVENQVANKLSEKARKELDTNKGSSYKKSGMSDTDFSNHVKYLKTVEGHYGTVLQLLSEPANEREEKLLKTAQVVAKKFADYKNSNGKSADRIRILSKLGIYEYFEYDSTWNRLFSWCYEDGDKELSYEEIDKLAKKYGFEVKLTKYDIVGGK